MYHSTDFTKQAYRVKEVADLLGTTPQTIRNYDKQGLIRTARNDGNQRIIMRDDLIKFLDKKGLIVNNDEDNKKDVIYARVSSHDQRRGGDLDRQALFIIENTYGIRNPVILKEVGSGLNDKRKQIQKLIQMVCNNEVRNVYVTYKDRLTRFGYHYLETVFLAHNVNIIIVKDIASEKSVAEELAEDLMSLIASFSGKLYGLRSGKNKKTIRKIKNEKNEDNKFGGLKKTRK